MVVAHVALLTGSWVVCLFFGKGVTGVTLIAGIFLITIAFVQQFFFLLFRFDSHVVTAAATASALNQLVRSHVGCRNGIQ